MTEPCNTYKKSKLSLVTATCLVMGNMLGAGVLMLPATLAKFGAYSFVGWIITSIGALCLALVFAKLSFWIPKAGGPYTFAMHVFGRFVGFQMAWSYWIFTWVSNVALVVSGLAYTSIFVPELNDNPLLSMSLGISAIGLFTYINTLDLKVFSLIQNLIAFFKVLPLILFCLIGIYNFNLDVFSIPSELGFKDSILQSAAITLWAFIGLESATIPSDNLENPKKTVHVATILGVSITTVIYILCSYALLTIVPTDVLSASPAPYVTATRMLFGDIASYVIAFIGVFCIAGTLHGWTLILAQVSMSASKSGLFPKLFAKKNACGSPSKGLYIGGALMGGFFLLSFCKSLTSQFDLIVEFSCFAILIPYIYSISAAFILTLQKKEEFANKIYFWSFLLAIFIGGLYAFFALIGLKTHIIAIGCIVFFFSLPVYAFVEKDKENE